MKPWKSAGHEQIAVHDVCVPFASEHPEQIDAILYGANSWLALDGLVSEMVLEQWSRGRSALCGGGQVVA